MILKLFSCRMSLLQEEGLDRYFCADLGAPADNTSAGLVQTRPKRGPI